MGWKQKIRVKISGYLSGIFSEIAPHLLIISVYSAIVSFIGVWRYISYQSSWDLGVFTQVFEGLLKLGFMYDSLDFSKNPSGNYLGVHFSPILYLLFPIYFVSPTPVTLIIMQTLFFALGSIPLYLLGKRKLGSFSSMLLSLAYLMHPGSLYLLLYDFHEISLFPTLLILSVYFYETKCFKPFFLTLILSCMVNEFTPIVMIFFSIYLIITSIRESGRSRKIPIASFVLSLFISFTAFYVERYINPVWTPQRGWITLGVKLEDIILNLLFRPDLVFQALIRDFNLKLLNLFWLLMPYLFMPVLSGEFMIVLLPWMGTVLLSSFPFYTIYLQYHAMNLPTLAVATILGVERYSKMKIYWMRIARGVNPKRICMIILFSSLLLNLLIGPLGLVPAPTKFGSPTQLYGYRIDFSRGEKHDLYDLFISLIPEDSVVLTQVRFYPQLADKTPFVLLEVPSTDWRFYEMLPFKDKLKPEYILLDLGEESARVGVVAPLPSAKRLLAEEKYGVLAEADSIVLYKLDYFGTPKFYKNFTRIYSPSVFIHNLNSTIIYSSDGEEILEYNGGKSSFLWYGPYEYYPPGSYEATFSLRIKSDTPSNVAGSELALVIDVAAEIGGIILASKRISVSELSDEWCNFTIKFEVPLTPLCLEFRGLYPHFNLPIQFKGIIVKRIDYFDASINDTQ